MDSPCSLASNAIAHSANPEGKRHNLVDHLERVAHLAQAFGARFGAGQLAYQAGISHDLGKFHPDFQNYLMEAEAENRRRGPDHKAAGVKLAAQYCEALAAPLQGHHGGLRDSAELHAWAREMITQPRVAEALSLGQRAFPSLGSLKPLPLPSFCTSACRAEFFIRMLFSALVDADFLDTEAHFAGADAPERGGYPTINTLWNELEQSQEALSGQNADPVSELRHLVYRDCLRSAALEPGFFRLTVPTGGGKTRSGLAFALRHAQIYGHDRIIVAVPYTSITDQTATTYRSIFSNPRSVLEHHSAIDRQRYETAEGSPNETWERLASENWDAPLIVTTTVQFFESLFARSTGKCRKLHNIANAVVILDEIQTLPAALLTPTLDVLSDLVANYGVTVVLCTATQPALEQREGFGGLANVREIVSDAPSLFQQLRRVEYETPEDAWDWVDVASIMRSEQQALAIVNTRPDAIALLKALDDSEALHLSTLLCGAHRRDVLDRVKRRLQAGEPCRLVATQVVEAGVDIDFPLVLRALAPLDRIVQAAGRCNREGRLESGRVIVFRPAEGSAPRGTYETGIGITSMMLDHANVDFHDPHLYQDYFEQLYRRVPLDARKIQPQRAAYNFATVAHKYRLIPDDSVPVVVSYGTEDQKMEVNRLLDALRHRWGNPREIWRELQPYILNVRQHEIERLFGKALIAPVTDSLFEWMGSYHNVTGIAGEDIDPASLVI